MTSESSYRTPGEPYARQVVPDQGECVLVTAGCTTGWADWIHGELWLCPDGLLRRSLGLATTVKHTVLPTVNPKARPIAVFSGTDIQRIVRGGRRNFWITWDEIDHASLRAAALLLWTTNGRKLLLMWVPVDDVSPLRIRLPTVLGDRLQT
jgi:hypothetical protein